MNGCTHFQCNSCDKIFKMEQQHIVKCAYTKYDTAMSEIELRFNIHHIQICDKCYKED